MIWRKMNEWIWYFRMLRWFLLSFRFTVWNSKTYFNTHIESFWFFTFASFWTSFRLILCHLFFNQVKHMSNIWPSWNFSVHFAFLINSMGLNLLLWILIKIRFEFISKIKSNSMLNFNWTLTSSLCQIIISFFQRCRLEFFFKSFH